VTAMWTWCSGVVRTVCASGMGVERVGCDGVVRTRWTRKRGGHRTMKGAGGGRRTSAQAGNECSDVGASTGCAERAGFWRVAAMRRRRAEECANVSTRSH
ncbi:hypothetical protein B0H16DRAFT_1605162, partial [Mycena metata]